MIDAQRGLDKRPSSDSRSLGRDSRSPLELDRPVLTRLLADVAAQTEVRESVRPGLGVGRQPEPNVPNLPGMVEDITDDAIDLLEPRHDVEGVRPFLSPEFAADGSKDVTSRPVTTEGPFRNSEDGRYAAERLTPGESPHVGRCWQWAADGIGGSGLDGL